ncbi:hypothetical protein [Streptomyces achromogenes]|uniref:hypothetical protein n=1 Tax=Streptomyces achromogenes TaxID=67255 RepID=UPI0033E79A27
MTTTATAPAGDQWTVLRGPVTGETATATATALAARHHLACEHEDSGRLRLTDPVTSHTLVTVRWMSLPPQTPRALGFQVPPPAAVDILIDPHPGGHRLAAELHDALAARLLPYTGSELDGIRAAMPLLEHYSRPNPAFNNWALLFRDHYLEHSTGFVLAMERAVSPPSGSSPWTRATGPGTGTGSTPPSWPVATAATSWTTAPSTTPTPTRPSSHGPAPRSTRSSTPRTRPGGGFWLSTTAGCWPAATAPWARRGLWTPRWN